MLKDLKYAEMSGSKQINFQADTGKMPIKMAVELGNREIIGLLLKHGAEWDEV